jgi:hypothetical protein
MPIHARRAAMKEAIGKARAYLTALATWQKSGKKKGKPGYPGSADHPTFYQGAFHLKLAEARVRDRFVRLKVYDGQQWVWMNYPARVVERKLDPHLVTVESPPHLAKRQMGIACD